ncbi:MAG: hypothetical protein HXY50_14745 [Ignavibacteriaceae bacterium]|nr:hypothetical protein [Ignavibacteriaceae bacterium]
MLTLISRKPIIITASFLLFIVIILFAPLKFEYKLKVQGKLLPQKEWIISKGADGRLITHLTNYKTGLSQSYDVMLFDRGDAMKFEFNPKIYSGSVVKKDDSIAFVYSNEIERQIENLKGQLITAKASLYLNQTGEKDAVISEAQNSLSYAIKQAEEQKKIVNRLKALYDRGLTSQEEYEIASGTQALYEINIQIAKARLQSVETGTKPEQIEFLQSQIISLEKELSVLKKRFDNFIILSPIDGIINRITNSDTLLSVSDTSEFVFVSPIRINDHKFISKHQKIDIYIDGKKQNLNAEIIELNYQSQIVQGIQIITATSFIKGKTELMIPGMLAEAQIYTGDLSPLNFLLRTWERMVN